MEEVNRVLIVQPDGRAAEYEPLKLCERVSLSQIIGLSGHNGFSSGLHLHLQGSRPIGEGKYHSISLRFLIK